MNALGVTNLTRQVENVLMKMSVSKSPGSAATELALMSMEVLNVLVLKVMHLVSIIIMSKLLDHLNVSIGQESAFSVSAFIYSSI